MQTIAIIDYGSGNLRSAAKSFERAAREADIDAVISVTNRSDEVLSADRIVLPGVGAYADCRRGLDSVPGMVAALEQRVIRNAVPFLGICVGMQLMADRGLEKAVTPGLGWISGDVVQITPDHPSLKIPQIGWNSLQPHFTPNGAHPILDGIETGTDGLNAYFVHSYHLADPKGDHLIATTDYGGAVTAIVGRDTMVGTQFHPEKSQTLGLRLIANFLKWRP
ncbi:MAG: imidazole glycerol phosphate synthase subunit HisH [Pseudomonadota bacterium]